MNFPKNIFITAIVCTLHCVHAKQVGTKQSTTSTVPTTSPSTTIPYKQPSYTPIPQEKYTTIFNMLQTTQPSTADYTTLMKIKNEVERQIKTMEEAPTKTISNQPSQQPQQDSQSRVAIRRATMNVDPWSSRDQIWIDEVWNSLTEQEKRELYNEKQQYVRWLAANLKDSLAQKLQQWLNKNQISFESEKL